jgi:hypothetical protein
MSNRRLEQTADWPTSGRALQCSPRSPLQPNRDPFGNSSAVWSSAHNVASSSLSETSRYESPSHWRVVINDARSLARLQRALSAMECVALPLPPAAAFLQAAFPTLAPTPHRGLHETWTALAEFPLRSSKALRATLSGYPPYEVEPVYVSPVPTRSYRMRGRVRKVESAAFAASLWPSEDDVEHD